MRNRNILLLLTAVIISAFAVSCGKTNERKISDSDSIVINEETPAEETPRFYLTSEGIMADSGTADGAMVAVATGTPLKQLPPEVEGLYDARRPGSTREAHAEMFYYGGEPMFTALDFMEGNVDMIYLENSSIKVSTPGEDISLGDEFRKLLNMQGIEAEWEEDDNGGRWMWRWNGLWFGVDPQILTDSLSRSLYDAEKEPSAEDFDETVRIGYIGTGLPF